MKFNIYLNALCDKILLVAFQTETSRFEIQMILIFACRFFVQDCIPYTHIFLLVNTYYLSIINI